MLATLGSQSPAPLTVGVGAITNHPETQEGNMTSAPQRMEKETKQQLNSSLLDVAEPQTANPTSNSLLLGSCSVGESEGVSQPSVLNQQEFNGSARPQTHEVMNDKNVKEEAKQQNDLQTLQKIENLNE